jgi:phage baseplate assembly protein W
MNETKNWQKKRGTIGEIVTDLDDIEQCYDNIFNTVKGSIPFQPNIGTNIIEAIGEKNNNAIQIVETIIKEEFTIQEPRAEVISITSKTETTGELYFFVTFQSKLTKEERSKKYYV